jgi:hypothetical protein
MLSVAILLSACAATPAAAPTFQVEAPARVRHAYVGETFSERFEVTAGEGELEIAGEALPPGAVLRAEPRAEPSRAGADGSPPVAGRATLEWTPAASQRGRHPVTLVASGPTGRARLEVPVVVEERWESWFLPGAQYVAYALPDAAGVGVLQGPAFELVLVGWVHDTADRGPSHGRIYLDIALLKPTEAGEADGVSYAAGLELSLERNPARSFLVPVFGVEIGGLHQERLGGVFQTVPFVGAHLWSGRTYFVTATAGYVFPGRDLERFGGWRFRAGVDFALW